MRFSPAIPGACAVALSLALSPGPAAAEIAVVASIKPLHSLVAGVMQGAGEPHLLVQGGASPHAMSLKPSDAAALQDADVVFWIGEGLEAFLVNPLESLAKKARVVELAAAPGLALLPYRADGHEKHEEDHAHSHDHDAMDMHLWLDPANARALVAAIAAALAEADPANAALYRDNAKSLEDKLQSLRAEMARALAPVREVPFVTFHDAFQYLEAAFGLNAVGAIAVNPEQAPGAARLREIQSRIKDLGARCVFAEPQFEPRLVAVAIEGTDARAATLDPLGAALADGPGLYFEMMQNNALALKACLAEAR